MVVGLSWQQAAPGALCWVRGVRASLHHGRPTPGYPEPGASRSCHVWLQEHPALRALCSGVSANGASLHWEHPAPGYPPVGASCRGWYAVRASLHHQHPGAGCTVLGASSNGSIELWAIWKQGIPAPAASCIRVSITACAGIVMQPGAQNQGAP